MNKLLLCLAVPVLTFADDPTELLRREFESYKQDTEARIGNLEKRNGNGAAPDLSERIPVDFEFNGYVRAGIGVNGDGDAMEAFQAPNSGAKYRLGNEAETYGEATFSQHFRTDEMMENNVDFLTSLTFAYYTPSSDNNTFDTTTSIREIYAVARGVWNGKKEALFWAGNRFYEHLDIHMNDFFFRDMAGFGGGVEDILLGEQVKFAVAWLGGSIDELDSSGISYTNDYHFNKNTLDLRLYDIDTGLGTLALSIDLADFGGDTLEVDGGPPDIEIDDSVGWAAGAILSTDLSDNLANRFSAQYGEGAADNFKAVITAPQGVDLTGLTRIDIDSTKRLRVTDDITVGTGSPLSLQAATVYEYYDNGQPGSGKIDWVSLGVRPVYHFNTYFSLAVEGGADYTNQKDGPEGVLGKLTIAPQVQPGKEHFARPSIRAFATYAAWSDGFKGEVATVSHADDTHGFSFGVQMEAWW